MLKPSENMLEGLMGGMQEAQIQAQQLEEKRVAELSRIASALEQLVQIAQDTHTDVPRHMPATVSEAHPS